MALEKIIGQQARGIAQVFAEEFKRAGVGMAAEKAVTEGQAQSIKAEDQARKKSVNSLQRYIDAHKEATNNVKKAEKAQKDFSTHLLRLGKTTNREFNKNIKTIAEQVRDGTITLERANAEYQRLAGKQNKSLQEYVTEHQRATQHMEYAQTVQTRMLNNLMRLSKVANYEVEQGARDVANQLRSGSITVEEAQQKYRELGIAAGEIVEELEQQKPRLRAWFDDLKGTVKGIVKGAGSFAGIMANLGFTVGQFGNDFRQMMKYGTNIASSTSLLGQEFDLFATQIRAGRLAIDPGTLAEIEAQARQTAHALGGVETWFGELKNIKDSFYYFVGDHEQAVRVASESMRILAKSGIEPLSETIIKAGDGGQSLFESFKRMQKVAGVTFEESIQMLNESAESAAIRFKLTAAANDMERMRILQGITARNAEMLALGFTTEQVKKAGDALEQIVGLSPKERFKQAAKAQVMLGALGVQGGDRAADIMRKGRRASADDQLEFAKIMGQGNKRLAEMATGSMGEEFFAMTLAEQLGMNDLLGPDSPFNTTLTQNLRTNENIEKGIQTMGENTDPMAKMLAWTIKVATHTKELLATNPLLRSVLIAVQMIAAVMATKAVSGVLRKGIGLLGGKGGKGGIFGKLGQVITGKLTERGGMLGGIGRWLGGSVSGLGAAAGGSSLLGKAGMVAGRAGGVGAAGAAGWAIGTGIRKAWEWLDPDSYADFGDTLGKSVDSIMSLFGSDEATKRLANMRMAEEELATVAQNETDKRLQGLRTQTDEMAKTVEKAREEVDSTQNKELTKEAKETTTGVKEVAGYTEQTVDVLRKMHMSNEENYRRMLEALRPQRAVTMTGWQGPNSYNR